MKRRPVIVGAGVVAVLVGWYLFRPELLFINKSVNEGFPSSASAQTTSFSQQATTLATGQFHKGAHETKGTASVLQLPGGQRVLRLTDFETSNGPDVRVLLIAAADATDDDTVKKSQPIEIGPLKGNIGDQNYDIPANVDLRKYQAVTIWCNRFSVNFGTAPLTMGSAAVPAASAMSNPKALASGSFHGVAHETKGTASVFELPDGKRVVRFAGFETSNGPDVRVLLIAAADATDNDTVKNAQPIELGALKGNIGDQNYDVPANVDLNTYKAVCIWCNRFGVNFATAPLTMP
jgi:hypothetical protein